MGPGDPAAAGAGSAPGRDRIRLSAVIATLGRAGPLAACLDGIARSGPADLDVIVVHQGQDDAIPALAERHGARYLRLERRGLSHARNRGIAVARGAWVWFPDDDCVPDPGFARALFAFLDARAALGFACANVRDPSGTALAPAMAGHEYPIRTPREVMRGVVSAGLVVARAALEHAGGFDERLGAGAPFPSGEESDLVLRLLRLGWRGAYCPDARVLHDEPWTVRTPAEQAARARAYGRGWGALFAKHGARPRDPRMLALFAEYLARAGAGAALAAVSGRAAEAGRRRASLAGRWSGFRDWLATPDAAC